MAVTLLLLDGGPALEIPDAAGQVWTYRLTALGNKGRLRCWSVEGGVNERCYEVQTDGQEWYCTCPAWQYRRRWDRDACKHCDALAEVIGAMQALEVKDDTNLKE